jgi:AraC family transcriptional regulator
MPVPETTSAEALDRYVVGKKIAASKGPAWRDVQLSVFSLPSMAEIFTMPAVTEPFIVWIASGEAEAQEREDNGPWVTSHLKKDSLFLTAAGAPYEFRWRTLTSELFQVVLVLLSVPLFTRHWRTCLVQMPCTLAFETCLGSKTRSSFRCSEY